MLGHVHHIVGNSYYAHIAGNTSYHVAGQPLRCEKRHEKQS